MLHTEAAPRGEARNPGPTTVFMPSGTANLNRDSLVLAHQTTTMDRSKLTARVGSLPELTLCAAERALLHALAIK